MDEGWIEDERGASGAERHGAKGAHVRCQVWSVKCQVRGVRCRVSGIRLRGDNRRSVEGASKDDRAAGEGISFG